MKFWLFQITIQTKPGEKEGEMFRGLIGFSLLFSSEFESLELLLEAPEVPDDELAVAGRGGDLVGPVLVAGHDLDGAGEQINIIFPSLNSNLAKLISFGIHFSNPI